MAASHSRRRNAALPFSTVGPAGGAAVAAMAMAAGAVPGRVWVDRSACPMPNATAVPVCKPEMCRLGSGGNPIQMPANWPSDWNWATRSSRRTLSASATPVTW